MNLDLKTLLATTYNEFKIQVRQRTTWLMAGLFFLIGWYSVDHASYPLLSAISIAKGTAEGIGLFGSVFVVTLSVTSFLREIQPTYDFLWTRPFHTNVYIVGKYLGVFAGVCAALLPVGIWVACLEFILYGFQGILIQGREWIVILAPSLMSALTAMFLLGLILKRTVATTIVMIIVIGGALSLSLDVSHLTGFAPYGIYASPLIDYGPDTRLVTLHRAFYLGLSIFVLALCLGTIRLTAPRLEKKIKVSQGVAWGLLLAGILAALFYTGINFQRERDSISDNPPYDSHWEVFQDCSIINSYRVELTIAHETGGMKGKAYIGLSPSSSSVKLPLDLNKGLQITQISISQQNSKVEVNEGIVSLTLPRKPEKWNVLLTLEYSGTLRIPRFLYDRIFRTGELAIDPFWPGGYTDGRTAFLTRSGNWHPLPDCPMDALTVELDGVPSQSKIIHTAEKVVSSSEHIVLIWERQPAQPLFTASPSYKATQLGATILLMDSEYIPQSELDWVFAPYPVLMKQIDVHLQQRKPLNPQPSQIAIVPFIKYGSYDPTSATLLLPETDPLLVSYDNLPYRGTSVLNTPNLIYKRWVAERMIRLWWCSDDICPALQVDGYSLGFMALVNSGEYTRPTVNALLTYAALRLAEPLVGQEFVAEELASRRRMVDYEIVWIAEWLPLATYSPDINRVIVRLDKLWNKSGAESFWRLAREYHRFHGTASLSEEEFENFVKQVTGVNLP